MLGRLDDGPVREVEGRLFEANRRTGGSNREDDAQANHDDEPDGEPRQRDVAKDVGLPQGEQRAGINTK